MCVSVFFLRTVVIVDVKGTGVVCSQRISHSIQTPTMLSLEMAPPRANLLRASTGGGSGRGGRGAGSGGNHRVNVTTYTNLAIADAMEEDGQTQSTAHNHTVFLASMNQRMGARSAWQMHVTAGTAELSLQLASVFRPFADDSDKSSTRPCMHCAKHPDGKWTPFRVVIPQSWGAARFNKQKMLFGNWCGASCCKGWFSERQQGPVLAQCFALVDARCVDLGIPIQSVAPPNFLMKGMGGTVMPLEGTTPDTQVLTYMPQYLPMSILMQVYNERDNDVCHVFGDNGGSPESLKPPTEDRSNELTHTRCKSVVQELQANILKYGDAADAVPIVSPFASNVRKSNARRRLTDVTKGAINTRKPPPLAPSTAIIESTAATQAVLAAAPTASATPAPAPAPVSVPAPTANHEKSRTNARRENMEALFAKCLPKSSTKKDKPSKKRQGEIGDDGDGGSKSNKKRKTSTPKKNKKKKKKSVLFTVLEPN